MLAAYDSSGDWRAVAGEFQVGFCCHTLCGPKVKRCLLVTSPYRLNVPSASYCSNELYEMYNVFTLLSGTSLNCLMDGECILSAAAATFRNTYVPLLCRPCNT